MLVDFPACTVAYKWKIRNKVIRMLVNVWSLE